MTAGVDQARVNLGTAASGAEWIAKTDLSLEHDPTLGHSPALVLDLAADFVCVQEGAAPPRARC